MVKGNYLGKQDILLSKILIIVTERKVWPSISIDLKMPSPTCKDCSDCVFKHASTHSLFSFDSKITSYADQMQECDHSFCN